MRVRRKRDRVIISLAAEEIGVLQALAGETAGLISTAAAKDESADPLERAVGMSVEPVPAPDDPALLRLFPAAYAGDDPDEQRAAAEFRRLMTAELQREKAAALAELLESVAGPPRSSAIVQLSLEEAERWLQALNDVRLVVGVRADVQEDMSAYWEEATPDDPRLPLLVAYDFLTMLQQSILEAVDGE